MKKIDFQIESFADGVWIKNETWKRINKFLIELGLTIKEKPKEKA